MQRFLAAAVGWQVGLEICHVQPASQPGVTFELDRTSYLDMRSTPLMLLCMRVAGCNMVIGRDVWIGGKRLLMIDPELGREGVFVIGYETKDFRVTKTER